MNYGRAMAFAKLNGTNVFYEDNGGAGPALVLSHGFLMDHSMFDHQVAALRDKYRVVTWDERGFGQTPATGPFDYWDSANDVLALMDHLGIGGAYIGGMSQGGFISLRVALLSPARVQGLILIDTQAGTEDPSTVDGYNQLRDVFVAHGPGPVQDTIASLILGPGQWPEWYAKWEKLDRQGFSHAFDCLMHRDDVTGDLSSITARALIVHGDADVAIPLAKAEALRDGLGGKVTMCVVPGAPHAANMTHPDIVNQAISDFLANVEPRAAVHPKYDDKK